jgi:hypothetical protein
MIDQISLGMQFLQAEFGVVPRIAWQVRLTHIVLERNAGAASHGRFCLGQLRIDVLVVRATLVYDCSPGIVCCDIVDDCPGPCCAMRAAMRTTHLVLCSLTALATAARSPCLNPWVDLTLCSSGGG